GAVDVPVAGSHRSGGRVGGVSRIDAADTAQLVKVERWRRHVRWRRERPTAPQRDAPGERTHARTPRSATRTSAIVESAGLGATNASRFPVASIRSEARDQVMTPAVVTLRLPTLRPFTCTSMLAVPSLGLVPTET